jgi:copper transport protein
VRRWTVTRLVRLWVCRTTVVIAACLAVGLLVFPAGAASAHPTLLVTTPEADGAVTDPPSSIVLVFSERVRAGVGAVQVRDGADRSMPVSGVAAGRGGRGLVATLAARLQPGAYTVRWRVRGADGDLMEGLFRFAVGAAAADPRRTDTSGNTSWPAAALRWLLFAGWAAALGGLAGQRWTGQARDAVPELPPVRSLVPAGVAVALAASVGLGALLVADHRTVGAGVAVLLGDRAGQVIVVEAIGFAVAALLLAARLRSAAAVSLLVVAAAEGIRGHANAAQQGWGALLTGVHLAAVAVWVGALVHVVGAAAAWRAQPRALWWLFSQYARVALWLFLGVVATGTVTGLLLVAPSTIAASQYGRVLLIKLGLVSVVAGLALAARLRLRHGHARVGGALGPARVESLVLVAVLAVTGVLVSTVPPGIEPADQPAAPAPVGPVVPLGALAGQIGVGVSASRGTVVVRLNTPQVGDYYERAAAQRYALSGRLVPAGGKPREVRLRGCGDGCFTGAAAWADGDNVLTLRASARGWRGGTVSLLVPWPSRPAAALLTRAVAVMRRQGTLGVYESVTSDASAPLPDPVPLRLEAGAFLASEPYSAGIAPLAVTLTEGPTGPRLALGFPAQRIYVQLLLDRQGRIQEETLTDAKHLIRRRFVYQDTKPG